MLQRSHTTCTLRGRSISPEFSLARFSMVCTRHLRQHPRLTALILFVLFILGMLVVLFFQCMTALLNPVNRARGIKWGLVSYTVAMFSFATAFTGLQLDIRSTSFIDNREFPGVKGLLPPGPSGYQLSIWSGGITIAATPTFLLNYWLADGLLVGSVFCAFLTRPHD